MIERIIQVEPRASDLDTQRHVTSRTYEAFAWQARFSILDEAGFSLQRLIDEKVQLVPLSGYVKFLKEQQPGAMLDVKTCLYKNEKNHLVWQQQVLNEKSEVACHILTETIVKKKAKKFDLSLFGLPSEKLNRKDETLLPLFTKIKPFSGKCRRVKGN